MILQALSECYDILANDPESGISRPGYSSVSCKFILNLNEDGQINTVIEIGDGKRGKSLLVPAQNGRTGKNPPSYFLCDNAKYLLGQEYDKKSKTIVPYPERFTLAMDKHLKLLESVDEPCAKAVCLFFQHLADHTMAELPPDDHSIWAGGNIVFRFQGQYVHENAAIQQVWEKTYQAVPEGAVYGQCLVTGKQDCPISRTHSLIKGVMGANPTGGSLVGFNASAFESYGKKQSYNAPVSDEVVFRYTTALNYLLQSNKNRMIMGDMTVVYWTDKCVKGTEVDMISFMMGETGQDKEEEKRDLELEQKIGNIMSRTAKGEEITKVMTDEIDEEIDCNTNVYILGLSPNNARISIRMFYRNTFEAFVSKMMLHQRDMEIEKHAGRKKYVYPRDILRTLAVQGKRENIPNSLENSLFTAIFNGTAYPAAIYTNILLRIKSEIAEDFAIDDVRAGFIKAYLKRHYRISGSKKEEEYTVGLNLKSENEAYHLGRLFAVLEKLQMDANGITNSTIKTRYFTSASSSPKLIFPILLSLAQHHIEKFDKDGSKIFYDKEISNLVDKINEFPSVLSLEDRGTFILGYYHQRKELFTSKEEKAAKAAMINKEDE